jgi:hypothetical protein
MDNGLASFTMVVIISNHYSGPVKGYMRIMQRQEMYESKCQHVAKEVRKSRSTPILPSLLLAPHTSDVGRRLGGFKTVGGLFRVRGSFGLF